MVIMNKIDALNIVEMASGNLCLNISRSVDWEKFPLFADSFVEMIGSKIVKKSDGPDMRIWQILTDEISTSLVFDDYPMMVSLEAMDISGNNLIERLYRELSAL